MEKSLKILVKFFSLDTESNIRESFRVFVNGVTAAGEVSPPPTRNFTNGDKVILGGKGMRGRKIKTYLDYTLINGYPTRG